MNWISSFFTTTSSTTTTTTTDTMTAIDQTDKSIEGLEARRMQYRKKARDLLDEARKSKDKDEQLKLMRQKAQYDATIKTLDGQIANLQKTSDAITSMSISHDVANSMKTASVNMKQMTSTFSVVDVEDTANDIAESMRDAQDMSNALSRPIGVEGYEQEEMDAQLLDEISSWQQQEPEPDLGLPNVPTIKNNNNNDNNGHYALKVKKETIKN